VPEESKRLQEWTFKREPTATVARATPVHRSANPATVPRKTGGGIDATAGSGSGRSRRTALCRETPQDEQKMA
jgi:hypothetical protein